MVWLNSKLEVKFSISVPSIFVFSLAYHEIGFALKSRTAGIIYAFFQPDDQNLILNSLETSQIRLCLATLRREIFACIYYLE